MPDDDAYVTTQPGTDTIVPESAAEATVVPASAGTGDPRAFVLPAAGYLEGELIGRGGMGEIVAATDTRIGREVAIKRMRGEHAAPADVARFLREARIQARLDHPAIVPVHELGKDERGRPYFTMKRLAGITLHDKLAQRGPIQPLLRAFVDVCFAVELAHARGVVHRDLKPANIMLGDYNDTYVLDWGVARVLDGTTPHAADRGDIDTFEDPSATAGVLGTPGYMAPEQCRGDAVEPATDVYALGAILFEILGGETLHPRGKPGMTTAIEEPQVSPAKRHPDRAIAPELDAACWDALAGDPAARPSARRLGERVQAYLDGDRDTERRRALAAAQLASARMSLATGGPEARALAVREAGRALALDPESAEAAQLVTQLVVEPPAKFPVDLTASLAREERAASSARSKRGAIGYASAYVFLIGLPWMHVKDWGWFAALLLVLAAMVGFALNAARIGSVNVAGAMIGNIALALVWSRIASPFMLTPVMICGVALALAANPKLLERRLAFAAFLLISAVLPIFLEAIGVIGPTWRVDLASGEFVVRSAIFGSEGAVGGIMLLLVNAGFVLVVGLYAIDVNRTAARARRAMHVQAWHLQQLLPDAKARAA